jgi:hypothetical protein
LTDVAGVARVSYDPAVASKLGFRASRSGYVTVQVQDTVPGRIGSEVSFVPDGRRPVPLPREASGLELGGLALDELVALQHAQVARLVVFWLENAPGLCLPPVTLPAKDVDELGATCAELVRRGASPGYVAYSAAGNGLPAPDDKNPRPWRDFTLEKIEDELALNLRRLGEMPPEASTPVRTKQESLHRALYAARELFTRAGWAPGDAPNSTNAAILAEARRRDFAARLSAATGIGDRALRDQTLEKLSIEAAGANEPETAASAVRLVSDRSLRDLTISRAAVVLKDKGSRAEAIDLSRSISDLALRDQTLGRLSQ